MRKLLVNTVLVLALIAPIFFVSSCETEGEINQADLIGTWDMGETSVDMKVGSVSLKQFLKLSLQLPDQAIDAFVDELTSQFDELGGGEITFNEDYSYAMVTGGLGEEGTWELTGDKLHMNVSGEAPDNDPMIVRSLSSSSALVAMEKDQEVDFDEDGTSDFNATIVIELNLSKH